MAPYATELLSETEASKVPAAKKTALLVLQKEIKKREKETLLISFQAASSKSSETV